MNDKKNIILIGPMGAGKTTIGRQLAKRLSKGFYDSDYEIERHTGVDIPLIFEIEGEKGFRKRESQVLEELVSNKNIVLSTGGGAVLDEGNRKLLSNNGIIIYLKSTAEKLYKRVANDKRRPLLQTDDRLNKIKSILKEREPIYLSLANEVIETQEQSIKQITQKIVDFIRQNENNKS
ncbi:MAG: shikimate kinase AroK [Gammaproteobacteria bacterium]